MIPKIIHYCWFGGKPYPEVVQKCIATWKKELPDYEFYLWDENNSPLDIPFVKKAYKLKKYAFVSDYIRLWALYEHGGIYLDTDMLILRSLNPLLDNELFFGWEEPNRKYISAGIIGAEKENYHISELLNKYKSLYFNVRKIYTIPMLITDYFLIKTIPNNVNIYPYDYFYSLPAVSQGYYLDYVTENSYAIHLWNASWKPESTIRGKLITRIKNIFYK